jgi:hypothetical protein
MIVPGSTRQEERGGGVAQIVAPDVGNIRGREHLFELPRDVARLRSAM